MTENVIKIFSTVFVPFKNNNTILKVTYRQKNALAYQMPLLEREVI
jgi:hypothetical protein